jgi:hypothetical protein
VYPLAPRSVRASLGNAELSRSVEFGEITIANTDAVKLHSRTVVRHEGGLTVSFRIDGLAEPELHFNVSTGFEGLVSKGYDAALLALLIPSMLEGKRIEVQGPVTEELIWSINEQVVPLLRMAHPHLLFTRVSASQTLEEQGGDAVLTGLSGGVDSLTVALSHRTRATPASVRVSHFVFNDTNPRPSPELVNLQRSRARSLAARLGAPLIETASNLARFHDLRFQATHSIQNATVPLLLSAGVRTWMYASGFPLSEVRAAPTRDLASIDPLLLPMLSTPQLRLLSVGGSMTRVEKTRGIAEWPVAQQMLLVCTRAVPNCGRCKKCLRTLLTLELLGVVEEFSGCFDLNAYGAERAGFVAEVLASDDFMLQELRNLALEEGMFPSWSARSSARLRRLVRKSRAFVRRRGVG